jgi:hypothetical protein
MFGIRLILVGFSLVFSGCATSWFGASTTKYTAVSPAPVQSKPDGPVMSKPVQVFPSQAPVARDIKPSASMVEAPCKNYDPHKGGGRAFFGIEANMCFDHKGTVGLYVVGLYRFNMRIPIADAGVMLGDRITKIRGCGIANSLDFRRIIEGTGPGDSVYIQVESRPSFDTRTLLVRTIAFYPEKHSEDRVSAEPLCGKIGLRQAPVFR